jgi:hypothetical protein
MRLSLFIWVVIGVWVRVLNQLGKAAQPLRKR